MTPDTLQEVRETTVKRRELVVPDAFSGEIKDVFREAQDLEPYFLTGKSIKNLMDEGVKCRLQKIPDDVLNETTPPTEVYVDKDMLYIPYSGWKNMWEQKDEMDTWALVYKKAFEKKGVSPDFDFIHLTLNQWLEILSLQKVKDPGDLFFARKFGNNYTRTCRPGEFERNQLQSEYCIGVSPEGVITVRPAPLNERSSSVLLAGGIVPKAYIRTLKLKFPR